MSMKLTRSNYDLLVKVLDVMEDDSKNTTGTFARRADGIACNIDDPRAVSFCFIGHLDKIGNGRPFSFILTEIETYIVPRYTDNIYLSAAALQDDIGPAAFRNAVRAHLGEIEIIGEEWE